MHAELFDFQTVPTIDIPMHVGMTEQEYTNTILNVVSGSSKFGSYDVDTGEDCTMEGIVTRNINSYLKDEFSENVFKYVRAKHVKTDIHWSRNWKRAPLKNEFKK